jgi:hypothetical protein
MAAEDLSFSAATTSGCLVAVLRQRPAQQALVLGAAAAGINQQQIEIAADAGVTPALAAEHAHPLQARMRHRNLGRQEAHLVQDLLRLRPAQQRWRQRSEGHGGGRLRSGADRAQSSSPRSWRSYSSLEVLPYARRPLRVSQRLHERSKRSSSDNSALARTLIAAKATA